MGQALESRLESLAGVCKSIVMLHGSVLTDCMSFAPIICPILRLKTRSKLIFFFAGRCPAPRRGAAPYPAGAPPQTLAGAAAPDPKRWAVQVVAELVASPLHRPGLDFAVQKYLERVAAS